MYPWLYNENKKKMPRNLFIETCLSAGNQIMYVSLLLSGIS